MSVPSASFGWSCTTRNGTTVRVELSANTRTEVLLTFEAILLSGGPSFAVLTRAQASALGAAIQLALLAVPEMEDDINGA